MPMAVTVFPNAVGACKIPKSCLDIAATASRWFFRKVNSGVSFNNGLPFSLSMGCGTWQKNSIDNNLNYKHFINITKISTTIKGNEPKLKDFFEDYCRKYHKEEIKDLD